MAPLSAYAEDFSPCHGKDVVRSSEYLPSIHAHTQPVLSLSTRLSTSPPRVFDDLYDATDEEPDLPDAYDTSTPPHPDGFKPITDPAIFLKTLDEAAKQSTKSLEQAANNAAKAMGEWREEYLELKKKLAQTDPESSSAKAVEQTNPSTWVEPALAKEEYKRAPKTKRRAEVVSSIHGPNVPRPTGKLAIDMNIGQMGGGRGTRARKAPKRFGEEDVPAEEEKTGATPAPKVAATPSKKRKREVEEPGAPTSPPPPTKQSTHAKPGPKKAAPPPPPPPSSSPPPPSPTPPSVAPAKLTKRKREAEEAGPPTSPPPAKRSTRVRTKSKKAASPPPPPSPPPSPSPTSPPPPAAKSVKRKRADEVPPPVLPPPPTRRVTRSQSPTAPQPPKPATKATAQPSKRTKLTQQPLAAFPAGGLASLSSAAPPKPPTIAPPSIPPPPPPPPGPAPKKRGRPPKSAALAPVEAKVQKKRGRPAKVRSPKASNVIVNDRGQKVDAVRSAAMSAIWARRIAEKRNGRTGGAPTEKTVKKREAERKKKEADTEEEAKVKEETPEVEEDDGDMSGGGHDKEGGSSNGEQDEGMAGGIAVEV